MICIRMINPLPQWDMLVGLIQVVGQNVPSFSGKRKTGGREDFGLLLEEMITLNH